MKIPALIALLGLSRNGLASSRGLKITLIAGAGLLLLLIGLGVWLMFAVSGWLWQQAPQITATGQEAAQKVAERTDKVLPDLQQKIDEYLPQITATSQQATKTLLDKTETILPGAREKLSELLPQGMAPPPSEDVGGEDIPGLARYPGLVRTRFELAEGKRIIDYEGIGNWHEARDFYAKELTNAGWKKQVLAADTKSETHMYTRKQASLQLAFTARRSGKQELIQLNIQAQ